MVVLAVLATLSLGAASTQPAHGQPAERPDRTFTVVNIEYEGTKVWVPGTLVVRKGERVRVKLLNNAPSGDHGWKVESYMKEGVTVKKGRPEQVEFVATEAGIFDITCHLHPAHIGGQLWVID